MNKITHYSFTFLSVVLLGCNSSRLTPVKKTSGAFIGIPTTISTFPTKNMLTINSSFGLEIDTLYKPFKINEEKVYIDKRYDTSTQFVFNEAFSFTQEQKNYVQEAFVKNICKPGDTTNVVYKEFMSISYQNVALVNDLVMKQINFWQLQRKSGTHRQLKIIDNFISEIGGINNLKKCVFKPIPYYILTANLVDYQQKTPTENINDYITLNTKFRTYLVYYNDMPVLLLSHYNGKWVDFIEFGQEDRMSLYYGLQIKNSIPVLTYVDINCLSKQTGFNHISPLRFAFVKNNYMYFVAVQDQSIDKKNNPLNKYGSNDVLRLLDYYNLHDNVFKVRNNKYSITEWVTIR